VSAARRRVGVPVDPQTAHQVIEAHPRSDVGGRCLTCRELEPCTVRRIAHAVLFGHERELPRRRPMELIGSDGDFTATCATPFRAFGPAS
jgi:hypothetical protein